jgi:hypothetical protein
MISPSLFLFITTITSSIVGQGDDFFGGDDDFFGGDDFFGDGDDGFAIPPAFAPIMNPAPTVPQPAVPTVATPTLPAPTSPGFPGFDDFLGGGDDDDFGFPPSFDDDDDDSFGASTSEPTTPTCASIEDNCNSDGDCCQTQPLKCSGGKCAACSNPGKKCEKSYECCNAPGGQIPKCDSGKCRHCVDNNEKCTSNTDCCSGDCDNTCVKTKDRGRPKKPKKKKKNDRNRPIRRGKKKKRGR